MIESERRVTAVASQLSIEEVYTDTDAISTSSGYQFDFPYQFNADESQNKLIGIRRLSVTPNNHIFTIGIEVYPVDIDGNRIGDSTNISPLRITNVMSSNSTEEILGYLHSELAGAHIYRAEVEGKPIDISYTFRLCYNYDQRSGVLEFYVEQIFDRLITANTYNIDFEFSKPTRDVHDINFESFLNFLNHEGTTANKSILTNKTASKQFSNVWNRSTINFHATFSQSHRQYIGKLGDNWNIPSKLYKYPYGCSNFTIWLTSDGVTKISLVNTEVTVELCFVLNYKNNISL